MNNRRINSKSSHEEAADVEAASLIRPQTVNESFTPFATCGEKGIPKNGKTPLTS